MSYARWGLEQSDVYVYPTEYVDPNDGHLKRAIVCCGCTGEPELENEVPGNFIGHCPKEMLDHLLEHRERGEVVPESALERLRREIQELEE